MKNSSANQAGLKSVVRRSVSALLILAALLATGVAKAADPKDLSPNQTAVASIHKSSDAGPKRLTLDNSETLIADQWALFCVTPYGVFPLIDLVPEGSSCYATFSYYPFGSYGIAE